jgi:aryl-alcohol dehydrogenase-like predicted oxidoreductase
MKRKTLPGTSLEVSEACLGTMTWGEQNSEAEAHAQLDRAVERGVNFIDTAEMYPVPPNPTTQGRTESILGGWLAKRGRDGLVIATKMAGPAAATGSAAAATTSRATRSPRRSARASSAFGSTSSTSTRSTGRSGTCPSSARPSSSRRRRRPAGRRSRSRSAAWRT